MLGVKAICDRRARKDGTSPVCIQYCYSSDERTVLNTEIYIPIKYWSKKLCRIANDLPPTFGDYEKLNLADFEKFRNKKITFSCLDLTFYEQLVDYLTFNYVLPNPDAPPSSLIIAPEELVIIINAICFCVMPTFKCS